MKLIDYDALFNEYLDAWLEKNRTKFKTPEELEESIEGVYFTWLEEHKDAFKACTDQELVEGLVAYLGSDITVPDLLCDEIVSRGEGTEDALVCLLEDNTPEATMLITNLLMQMQSEKGCETYLKWIAAGGEEDELADIAVEAMQNMESVPVEELKKVFRGTDNACAKERIADILSHQQPDEEIYRILLDMFIDNPEMMTAVRLARLGDVRAIEPLTEALKQPEIDYINFVEIKNAVESLGGIVEFERDFNGDPYYEKMKTWEMM